MCGRFTQPGDIEIIQRFREQYGLDATPGPGGGSPDEPPPPHEAAVARPYGNVWVFARDKEGELKLTTMYWQLIHYWCGEFKSDYTAFNTRLESLGKRHNIELLAHRRCVFPATSFFETRKDAAGHNVKPREAYEFMRRDRGLIPLGGIYTVWRNPADKSDYRLSCSIITLEPDEIVGEVHPRMPFILSDNAVATWLDRRETFTKPLRAMIRPYPSELLVREREI